MIHVSIILLFLASLLAVSSAYASSDTDASDPSDFVEASTDQALRSIRTAQEAGADVSELVNRLDVALDLQRQAERTSYVNCPSYNDCVLRANDMLLSVVHDASMLGNQAIAKREQAIVMTFTIYLPVLSFVVSIAIIVLHNAAKSRKIRKFENLDIRQRRTE